jgi:HSP20 family molecular chaperone IbpA
MEVLEKTEQKVEKAEEESPKYWAIPSYHSWRDEEKITIEIALPGVKREHIKLKTERNNFMLEAKRNRTQYELNLRIRDDIEAEKTSAKYEEGLLTVELKRYKPDEHAVDVKIE